MKKEKESKKGKDSSSWAILFLIVALISWGFDLFHFAHHLGHDQGLIALPGVLAKLVWKGALVSLTSILLILSVVSWLRTLVIFFAFSVLFGSWGRPSYAATDREDCEKALEYMKESGMARDAKENFFGRLKIKPPRSSFPPEMDQVTWWGRFKPFEFWESPHFDAVWINPRGEMVERQSFQGGRCELAKTTLSVKKLPMGQLEPGTWRVVVSCQDVVIDNHPFPVIGSPTGSPDGDRGIMIWADDINS